MADAELASLPDETPPSPNTGPPVQDSLAIRIRGWYLEARRSEFWQRYCKNQTIDRGYYLGGEGQWVDDDGGTEDLDRLKTQKRAHVSINQIKPIVKILTGLERQTRFDPKIMPQGEEDEQDAQSMSWLLKFVYDMAEVHEHRSEAFKMALIEGMRVLAAEIDYAASDNPAAGEITVSVLEPGTDILWDPTSKDYALRDCAYVLRHRWAWVEDLVAMFPDHAAKIRASVDLLHQTLATPSEGTSTDGPTADAYGQVGAHPIEVYPDARQFYDPQLRRALVVEAWYATYRAVWYVANKVTGKFDEAPDGESARLMVASDPKNLSVVRRLKRRIKTATVIPATAQTLEDDETPYENDAEDYPFVPVIAERIGDDVRGIVRDLRDPQRVENKRISQAIDLVSRWSKLRRVAQEGSVVGDPALLDDVASEKTIWYKPGAPAPGWDVPVGLPELTRVLVGLSEQMKISIRETSGINADLLGLRDDTRSGIAIARLQAQGQVIATEFFDHNRRSGKILAQRVTRRIQQKFTLDEYVRLTNDLGASVVVHLNPVEFRHLPTEEVARRRAELAGAGKPAILRDVSKLKYDLVISEAPATPTARSAALQSIMDILRAAPAYFPLFAETIIKLTDGLPDKHEILQRLAAMQGMAQGGTGTPTSGPPAAGVPGVPGAMPEDTTSTVAPPPAPTQLPRAA